MELLHPRITIEDLPSAIVIDILSRLPDCLDLARSRLASRTLNSLSHHISSLRFLFCGPYRRNNNNNNNNNNIRSTTIPFKSLVTTQIALLHPGDLRSLFVGVHSPFAHDENDDDDDKDGNVDEYDEGDDLLLTDVDFVERWLPAVAGGLRSLVVDFWVQSCWRTSALLALISTCFCCFFQRSWLPKT